MERFPETPDVMLIDEVAVALKITAKQIRRLEQRGAFPIPRVSGEISTLMTRRRRAA